MEIGKPLKKSSLFNYQNEIISENKLFTIEFFDPYKTDKNFNFIYGKDCKYYVISEKHSNFQIKMIDKRLGSKCFGSKLYIDGKEINKIKTSIVKGTYFGFKLGSGKYQSFVFDEPDISKVSYDPEKNCFSYNSNSDISTDDQEINKINKYFGKIKIDFFDTHQEDREKYNDEFKDFTTYKPSEREGDKKLCLRSQTIKKGKEFNRKITFTPRRSKEDENKFSITIIDFDKNIDSITINYQDFLSLNIIGVITMGDLNHLRFLPKSRDYLNFAVKALKTIIIKDKDDNIKMDIDLLLKKFKQYTEVDFDIFINDEKKDFISFIMNYFFREFKIKDNFLIIDNICDYSISSKREKMNQNIKIPAFKDKVKYVTRPYENKELQYNNFNDQIKSKDYRDKQYLFDLSMDEENTVKQNITVDLTLDEDLYDY